MKVNNFKEYSSIKNLFESIDKMVMNEGFDDDMSPMEYGDDEEEYQGKEQDIAHYQGGHPERTDANPEEEKTDMNLSKSDKRIAQIREIALNGLQDYAEDVDCEAYQFYKKIWLMCDKAVSEKDSASGNIG